MQTPNNDANDIRALWQAQPLAPPEVPVTDIQTKAARFREGIAARNRRESIAFGLVGIFFVYGAVITPEPLLRFSFILFVAGGTYVGWYIRKHAVPRSLPGPGTCIDFYREELERERDLLRRIWRWYLGPLLPGFLVFSIATGSVGILASSLTLAGGIGWLNWARAVALQRELDALPPPEHTSL